MAMNLKFFVLGGIILVLSGGLQALVRPREAAEVGARRFINRSTVRAVVFVLVGGTAILIGLGVLPLAQLGF